ncbi:hypothetical protein [Paraflavitalea speifideaquila]|uniref:hypothetical protein n=1 Tax=Paraflavitalea speifideaquila TaxID=3076558 RepID=UPI0028E25667|nr:hypothetical protein [Paraflavitalea speifideiaquila]
MIRPATFNRLTARVNLNSKVNNWLTLTSSTLLSRANTYGVTDNAGVAKGGVVLSALATPPTVGKYRPDGSVAQNPLTGWENPLGAIEGTRNKNTSDRILSNLGMDIRLWKGLVYQSRLGIDYQTNLYNSFLDPFMTQDGRNNKGRITETRNTQLIWLSEQLLNYSVNWHKNRLTALAGWTAQDSHFDETSVSGTVINASYRHESYSKILMLAQTKNAPTKTVDDWALMSYLGRVTYDYAGKYLLQGNVRMDRSSKFAPGNRNATFPSFSGGWRISQEDFLGM